MVISNADLYEEAIRKPLKSKQWFIVPFGIVPTKPETGY
jgi:mannose-1-phosphate guanylyltransferase